MYRGLLILAFPALALAGGSDRAGDVPPSLRPPPRLPPPPPGASYDARFDRFRALENEVNRSTGRIVDEQTFLLDQHDRRFAPIEQFKAERDRALRIEARQLAERREGKRTEAQQREAEMRLKEYELYVNAGIPSLIGEQAERDRIALQEAKNRRDEELRHVTSGEQRAEIEARYQRERSHILGFDAPTTGPSQ
jgi:hypothetical protein